MPLGGKREVRVGKSKVRLPDVDTGRLLGLKYRLVCRFKLTADMVEDFREFVNHSDGPAFQKRELVGLGVNGYCRSEFITMKVDQCQFTSFKSI